MDERSTESHVPVLLSQVVEALLPNDTVFPPFVLCSGCSAVGRISGGDFSGADQFMREVAGISLLHGFR